MLASKCKQARKRESSFFQCPYVGLQEEVNLRWLRLKVFPTMPGFATCSVPGWPSTQRSVYLSLLGLKVCTTLSGPKPFKATMPQDLHVKDLGQKSVF